MKLQHAASLAVGVLLMRQLISVAIVGLTMTVGICSALSGAEAERRVIVLHYQRELMFREIAEVLSVTRFEGSRSSSRMRGSARSVDDLGRPLVDVPPSLRTSARRPTEPAWEPVVRSSSAWASVTRA